MATARYTADDIEDWRNAIRRRQHRDRDLSSPLDEALLAS